MSILDIAAKPFEVFSGADSAKKQAKKQMQFQERMSNTAYQRAAEDLEKAGLNRILAIGSPATTPTGAAAPIPNMLDSAISGAKMASGLATDKAQRRLMSSQSVQSIATAKAANAKAGVDGEQAKMLHRLNEAGDLTTEGLGGLRTLFEDSVKDPDIVGPINSSAKAIIRSMSSGTGLPGALMGPVKRAINQVVTDLKKSSTPTKITTRGQRKQRKRK